MSDEMNIAPVASSHVAGRLHYGLLSWSMTLASLLMGVPSAHAALGTTGVNGMQVFAASGTWTAPSDLLGDNITHVQVLLCGGGAGGSAADGTGAFAASNGAAVFAVVPVTPGQTYTVTIGAAGSRSDDPSSTARNGGASSFVSSTGQMLATAGGAQVIPATGGTVPGSGSFDSTASAVVSGGTIGDFCLTWIAPRDTGKGGANQIAELPSSPGYVVVLW